MAPADPLKVPASHATHVADVVMPTPALYEPALHLVQAAAPVADSYVPGPQVEHAVAPAAA